MRSVWVAATLGLAAVGAGGCAERIPTQVVVRIEADEATRARAESVRIEVWGRAAAAGSAEVMRFDRTLDVAGGDAEAHFPLTLPLVPEGGDEGRRFVVVAGALDAGGTVFVSRRVRSGYVRDRLTEIVVTLRAECHGVADCDAAHTCIGGTCDDACVLPRARGTPGDTPAIACTDVPPADDAGGPPDAGADGGVPPDAGPPDTGPPDAGPPPECTTPADCLAACPTAICEGETCVPDAPLRTASVATGQQHTCALLTDGTRLCAGNNGNFRLGLGVMGSTITSMTRTRMAEPAFRSVTAGTDFTCGIRTDGVLACAGHNDRGQLGNGDASATPADVMTPEPIAIPTPASGWMEVDAGSQHACAITGAGVLHCWGRNHFGQLGLGAADALPHPMPAIVAAPAGTTGWASLGLGASHTCAIADDFSLWCWGAGSQGRLGLGTTSNQPSPMLVGLATDDWRRVRSGNAHACGIRRRTATLWCWGSNVFGQLGDGTTDNHLTPAQVGTRSDWTGVSLGTQHSCGIAGAGELLCWGTNADCQLGLPRATESALEPTRVAGDGRWSTLAAGSAHTCAIDDGGVLSCWGQHASGQVGAGPPPPDEICGPRVLCMPSP